MYSPHLQTKIILTIAILLRQLF